MNYFPFAIVGRKIEEASSICLKTKIYPAVTVVSNSFLPLLSKTFSHKKDSPTNQVVALIAGQPANNKTTVAVASVAVAVAVSNNAKCMT